MSNFRTISWLSVVLAHEKNFYKPDIGYEFSGDRKFYNTDKSKVSGIYGYGYIAGDDGELLVGDDGEYIMGDLEERR